ncbi:hypothetical protein [uncultured Clostridium sp.]|uniref:hypothetical protein n=1 Tax=uncultured Clostridium sp. TaxID=59620 RepID=UPI0026F393E7|nr:hypothetical protein [uncultured Clostridium sp.]
MRIRSLLGITAPMILLAPLSVDQIKRINELLNNKADSTAILDFKSEVRLINEVYSNRFRKSPIKPSEIRNFRLYKNAEKFWEEEDKKKKKLQDRYKEPKNINNIWSREQYENYRDKVLPNIKLEYTVFRDVYGVNSGKIYKPNYNLIGDMNELSKTNPSKYKEVKTVQEYFDVINRLPKGMGALNLADKTLIINEFKEVRVFGYSLFTLLSRESFYLQYKLINSLKETKSENIKNKLIQDLIDDIELIKSLMNPDRNVRQETPLAPIIKSIDKSLKAKGIIKPKKTSMQKEYLDAFKIEFLRKYPKYNNSKVFSTLVCLNVFKDLSLETLDFLEEIHKYVCKFDVKFYNTKFGLDYTEEQYRELFHTLGDYGIAGLTLNAEKHFLNSLERLNLTGTQEAYVIPENSYLAKNAFCLFQYCEALKPFGEEL